MTAVLDEKRDDAFVLALIQDLGLSRSDCLSAQKRNDLVKLVEQFLSEKPGSRKALAESAEIRCTSSAAYKRVAKAYCVAVRHETGDDDIRKKLCLGLCSLLKRSSNGNLLQECKQKLVLAGKKYKEDNVKVENIFSEIANEDVSSLGIPALAFMTTIDWKLFVKLALSSDPMATVGDMELCQFILADMDKLAWEDTVGPAAILKLKSKPESVLSMLEGMTRFLNSVVLASSKIVADEYLAVLVKNLKSPREPVREQSSLVLQHIAKAAIETSAAGGDGADLSKECLAKLVESVADTKALTQPHQRQIAYDTLYQIGANIAGTLFNATSRSSKAKKKERKEPFTIAFESRVISTVLTGISAPLAKEAKSATENRDRGIKALLVWTVLAKRNADGGGKGYEEALSFMRKPVVSNNSSDAVAVLGAMVQQIHPDTMEKLVLDLWKDPKFVKGLDGFVEDGNKKQASQSSIPPVDGLLAIYLNLLYANVSSSKLPSLTEKALSAGSFPLGKTSFVYGAAITNSLATNPLVGNVLPAVIALYTRVSSSTGSGSAKLKTSSAEVRALACCVAYPVAIGHKSPAESIEAIIRTVLDYKQISEELVGALFARVNDLSLEYSKSLEALNANRQAREDSKVVSIKGKCSPTGSHSGACVGSIRRIARMLSTGGLSGSALAQALTLLHSGTSVRSTGQQRSALVKHTTEAFKVANDKISENGKDLLDSMTVVIAETLSLDSIKDGSVRVSESIYIASQSLVVSLGSVACNFSPLADDPEDEEMKPFAFAMDLLTKGISSRLADQLSLLVEEVEALSSMDVGIFRTAPGTLFKEETDNGANQVAAKDSGKGRRSEEEEWELQMKKELAKKKAAASEGTKVFSAEEKKTVAEQDAKRESLSALVDVRFQRILASVGSLVGSDIEIGNSCLHSLSPGILKLSVLDCPAMRDVPGMKEKAIQALTCLSACVYEIQEEYAVMMALALTISCRNASAGTESSDKPNDSVGLEVSPLPSPCEPAATTIFEMDEFQEELSGNSFCFLFPVIRAALYGPRTTPGCEGALRVLERHTRLLAGDECDPNVKLLRTDMVSSVLELLRHDRAQAFNDPNPYDTLVACYQTDDEDPASSAPALSTAELAPLLDERGALGGKNCRMAAMIALGSIAVHHKKLVKSNPLIESRIWLNCFDSHDAVRTEARKTWGIIHDQEITGDDLPPPSALYAIPLISLLNNKDESIAAAAAKAYSHGMKAHPNTVNRNVVKLCSTYIDSFPSPGDTEEGSSTASPFPEKAIPKAAPAPAKKPLIATGLKKKTVKKSALQVAGIGQPKKKTTKKKTAMASALLKPKQERTLDQATLESQFKTGPQKTPPEKDSPEKASVRLGILKCLSEIPPAGLDMNIDTLKLLTSFLMAYGIADGDEGINNCSRDTLRDVIAAYGASEQAIAFLLPDLDGILKTGSTGGDSLGDLSKAKIPSGVVASDRRKEGAVVALGSVAIHLKGPENASKIDNSVDMLLSSLKTPNADVQASVADALSKLMKKGNTQDRVEHILDQLMNSCLEGESTATRRGAGFGIAAVVKGSGIATLKKFGIVTRLEEACASGTSTNKEGSLFAIQSLCARLGLLFEPYVIVLLPSLLKSFGDGSDGVRRAASEAVGVIMSKLSAHGVKLVLPAVLTAFNDNSWRTKQASINMLGSMSHLAPKQLASALPKVVPKLIEAFADTHPKVKASAQGALEEISSVIRNPEIHDISPVLLKALTDPADNTLSALEALIETEFLHAIDAPSLALIVPILHRGLRDRSATTKRYGALITGNICTMINDPRDFVPYLPTLIPDLKSSLLDPIPDVRSIAAKAFGSLTRGLGEDALPDLRPWLIEELQADGLSSAERSGAAQGLTEVLIASGTTIVENVMQDDILPLASHPSASTREGVLWVLCFLPPALGQGFTSLLDDSLPPLINGLSDDNEQVREVAMRAGRVLIKSHGKVHFDKILPILRNGMEDADFRIRYSSLMLLGDLLSMIGGTTVLRTDGDTQDDIRRAERAQAQLTLVLGIETRNRVLSDVYLARSDNAVVVRQAAVQVWKTVVSVTARTLRQILPVLVGRVVSDLASGDAETTETAGKCLGDIVGKLGDSVLPEIIPELRNSLYDGDSNTRRGVCVGLSEVIGSSTKDQILRFLDIIVKVVQDALCDDDASVRAMAASSFQNLYNLVGNRAMDEVVPALMVALENTEDETRRERALNGLTGILSIRSKELLPYIIPKLIQQPITENHAKALSSIATVTGTTLYYHFRTIIPAMLTFLATGPTEDKDCVDAARDCVRSVFGNADEAGINNLISEIASKCSSDRPEMRRECCWMMQVLVEERKEKQDFYDMIPVIIRELIQRFNDDDMDVVKAANKAFAALSKHVPAEELAQHIEYMRNLINSMVSDARRRKGGVGDGEFLLPGFNIPKGLEPLLPIYQRGILYGTPAIREASASGLGEAIELTANKYLAGPLIIKMTGPLLRIVGDRNPSNVKISILKTLGLILVKGGPALRAFVPQFQTTFVKALSDPSRQVRVEAIAALGLLMPLSTRVDPLIKELVAGSLGKGGAGADGTGAVVVVQSATLEALAVVLGKGGKKAKLPDSIPSALEASVTLIRHSDDSVREAAAKVMGAACDILGPEKTDEFVQEEILPSDNDDSDVRHGKACAIRRIFSAGVGKDLNESVSSDLRKLATKYMKDEKLAVQEAGIVAVGAAVGRSSDPVSTLRGAEADLLPLMGDLKQRLETHQAVARCLCLALELADVPSRVAYFGTTLLNVCLKLAMSGSQRVQFAFNDVLWLALDVSKGQAGLDEYSSSAMFEDSRQMKSLYSKVLVKIKKVTILDD